jgi:AAA15 family ATPase/GTPase
MESQHLTYFKVENFKKFDSLEVKDIGQFNLIVGDNNVGKTCLLEALLFDKRPKNTINWYQELLVKRRLVSSLFMLLNEENIDKNFNENTFSYYQKNKKKPIKFTLNKDIFSLENKIEELRKTSNKELNNFIKKTELFDYDLIKKKSKNWIIFKENEEVKFLLDLTSGYYENFINHPEDNKIPSLPALMLNDEIEVFLGHFYEEIFIKRDFGKKVVIYIHQLFPNIKITEFQQSNTIGPVFFTSLKIKTEERNYFHNIREYGEGFIRCVYIILKLSITTSKKIVIDEIDTGIYHERLEKIWETVLTLCLDLKIQLFATTHSKECAEAYIKAAKLLNQKNENKIRETDLKLIEMMKIDDEIKTLTYKGIERLEYSIKNLKFRGEAVN